MQTVGAKHYFLSLAFSFRKTPRRHSRLKKTRTLHSRYRRRSLSRRTYRNRILTQRRVEAGATRGNWIRDFDQFRRQRRFAVPGANPEFTVRITARLAADSAAILPLEKELMKCGIRLFRFATYSWFLLNADALQLSGNPLDRRLLTQRFFIPMKRKEIPTRTLHACGKCKGLFLSWPFPTVASLETCTSKRIVRWDDHHEKLSRIQMRNIYIFFNILVILIETM